MNVVVAFTCLLGCGGLISWLLAVLEEWCRLVGDLAVRIGNMVVSGVGGEPIMRSGVFFSCDV